MSALHAAARDGNYATAEDLVNHGTNVNQLDERRYTPLHYAARSGIVRVCQLLLDARGDVSVLNSKGQNPLYQVSTGSHGCAFSHCGLHCRTCALCSVWLCSLGVVH